MREYLIEQDDEQEYVEAKDYVEALEKACRIFGIHVSDITEIDAK